MKLILPLISCDPAGAVFNLICDDRDANVMAKIERHFGTHIAEVWLWIMAVLISLSCVLYAVPTECWASSFLL